MSEPPFTTPASAPRLCLNLGGLWSEPLTRTQSGSSGSHGWRFHHIYTQSGAIKDALSWIHFFCWNHNTALPEYITSIYSDVVELLLYTCPWTLTNVELSVFRHFIQSFTVSSLSMHTWIYPILSADPLKPVTLTPLHHHGGIVLTSLVFILPEVHRKLI